MTDGEWHHLLIELKSAKEGKDIKYLAVMTLDYGMDQVSWRLRPLWARPLRRVWGKTEGPFRAPGPCRALGGLGAHALSPPEFRSHICLMLRPPEPAPDPLSQWSAAGVRKWTPPVCPNMCLQQGLL